MSFFDEDDEPLRTTPRPRPRPRRGRPAGGAVNDSQTIYMRRAVLGLGLVVVVLLLGLFVKGCRDTQAKNALKDYNNTVSGLATESQDTGRSFLKLFDAAQPSATELQSSILSLRAQADTTLKQAQRLSVPDAMVPAQQSLLIAFELRRNAYDSVAESVRTALGDSGEQADKAIAGIAGQMSALSASDVLYSARVVPFIQNGLSERGITNQDITASRVMVDVDWLSKQVIASKLGQQLSSGTSGDGKAENAQSTGPGLHGTGLKSTSVGNQTLSPDAANQLTYTSGMVFAVAFTNQGENDEFNVKVTLKITPENGSPITLSKTVESVPKGQTVTAELPLTKTPPLNTAVQISVNVATVVGEKKADNNKSTYNALFQQG